MSVLLAIDTAAPRLAIAMLQDGNSVDTLIEDMATGQAERLFPAMRDLFVRAASTIASIAVAAAWAGRTRECTLAASSSDHWIGCSSIGRPPLSRLISQTASPWMSLVLWVHSQNVNGSIFFDGAAINCPNGVFEALIREPPSLA